jgi:hypothetical protein
MTALAIGMNATEEAISAVMADLSDGKIDEAIGYFSNEFRYRDYGIGLEFKDKRWLGEFFKKVRELYSDSDRKTETILVSGETVVMQWTLQATVMERFYGEFKRNVRVSVSGASIVRTQNQKITDWADYYDGLTSRRRDLALYFTEWVDL